MGGPAEREPARTISGAPQDDHMPLGVHVAGQGPESDGPPEPEGKGRQVKNFHNSLLIGFWDGTIRGRTGERIAYLEIVQVAQGCSGGGGVATPSAGC